MEVSCKEMVNVANIFETLVESTYFQYKKNIEYNKYEQKKFENESKEEKNSNKKLIYKIEEDKNMIKELNKKIVDLENKLKEEKNNNKKLINKLEENKNVLKEIEQKIVKLENKLKEEKDQKSSLKEYIMKSDKLIKDKDKLIKDEKKKFMELNKKMKELEKIMHKDDNLKKMLEMADEIKELKNKLPFELSKEEKLMTINLISYNENIFYSFICKNTHNFYIIENLFYEKFPEYKELKSQFLFNGKEINKDKNFKENKIFDNSIINIKFVKT